MALSRKFLTALGIEPEKVDEIITAHSETVDALKAERDKAKSEAETFKKAADELPGVKEELESLKEANSSGRNPYEVKYNALKEEFEAYKTEQEQAKVHTAKLDAYRKLLTETGISEKRIDAVLKVSDVDAVELNEDGNIRGADKMKESIAEEWADFIVKEETHGADTSTPPANNGTGAAMTKDEIFSIKDAGERQKAIAENIGLFQ